MRNLINCKDIDSVILNDILDKSNSNQIDKRINQVLGLLFLSESTRTSNSLKAAMIKLGGGWIGLEGLQGSYLAHKLDTIENSLKSLSNYCEIIAIRSDIEEKQLANISTPIINAGNDCIITPLWGIWLAHLMRIIFGYKSLSIGVYGLSRYSAPIKSYYSVLSLLGYSFYEDSIINDVSASDEMIKQITNNGSIFQRGNLEDFIERIDLLIIADCFFEKQCNNNIIDEYIDRHHPINNLLIDKMKRESRILIVEPYKFQNGKKSTITDDLLKDKRIVNDLFNKQSVISNIGIIKHLLSL